MGHCDDADCNQPECKDQIEGTCEEVEEAWGQHQYWLDCGENYSTSYETALNVLADTPDGREHNEIQQFGTRVVWLNTWMSDPPDHVLDEDCEGSHHCGAGVDGRCDDPFFGCCNLTCDCTWGDYYTVQPESVFLGVQHDPHRDDNSTGEFDLAIGTPTKDDIGDSDDSSDSPIEEILVPAIAAVSFNHPIARAGAAASKAYIAWNEVDDDHKEKPFELTRTTDDGRRKIEWEDIPIEGDTAEDLPQAPCNNSQVSFRITDTLEPGEEYGVQVYSQFTWKTLQYMDGGSDCPTCQNYAPVYVEGRPVQTDFGFDIV